MTVTVNIMNGTYNGVGGWRREGGCKELAVRSTEVNFLPTQSSHTKPKASSSQS